MSIWPHASRGRTQCDSTPHPQTLGPAAKSFATFLLMHLGDSGMSRQLGDVSVTRGTAVDVPVVGRALLCRQRTAGARTAIGGHCDGANAGPRHHPHRRRPGALTCTCTHIVAAAWACILPIGFRERASYRPVRVDERPSFQGRWASERLSARSSHRRLSVSSRIRWWRCLLKQPCSCRELLARQRQRRVTELALGGVPHSRAGAPQWHSPVASSLGSMLAQDPHWSRFSCLWVACPSGLWARRRYLPRDRRPEGKRIWSPA